MLRVIGLAVAAILTGTASGAQGLDCALPTVLHTFTGPAASTYGGAVSGIRDIDRDGAQDVIIGAPRFTDASGIVGLVEVRSGRTGSVLYKLHGQPGDRFGYSVADAGDVDGDRVSDVAVGAPGVPGLACTASAALGTVYVYSGRTGSLIKQYQGVQAGAQFGAAIISAGDTDRDGYGDLVVGAPCSSTANGAGSGAAYVISGATGTTLRTHLGSAAGEAFGWGAGTAGDAYIIGAPDAGPDQAGSATVFDARRGLPRFILRGDAGAVDFGWFFTGPAGDTNHDHVEDIYVGDFSTAKGNAYVFSGRTGAKLWRFDGAQTADGAGPGRGAGDVDHDGYADVVVGSYTSSAGASFGGQITVYSGRTGKAIVVYSSVKPGELLGFDAVGIGDVNHDGRAELLVSGSGSASVYVISV